MPGLAGPYGGVCGRSFAGASSCRDGGLRVVRMLLLRTPMHYVKLFVAIGVLTLGACVEDTATTEERLTIDIRTGDVSLESRPIIAAAGEACSFAQLLTCVID